MLETRRKLVITGGAGFIGSHLIDSLMEDGHQILCLDSLTDFYNPEMKWANITPHLHKDSFSFYKCDIRDSQEVMAAFSAFNPEIVIHLAANAGVRPSINSPEVYLRVNIEGTLNVLEAAVKVKAKKFIFASSSSVYGINNQVPFNEADPVLSPISPYAATKIAGEALCHTYSKLYGLPVICLRFFTVYGPRQRPDLAIHKFTRLILRNQSIPVYGDGISSRDYTYVDDIIKGIRSAINFETGYDLFNLGNSTSIELNLLISLLENLTARKAIIQPGVTQPGDVYQTWADITKAGRLLDYRPSVSIEQGLEKFLSWYHTQKPFC